MAVILDAHVPHLAGHTVRAMVNFPVVYDTAADARTQGDGYKALTAAAGAGIILANGGAVTIVFQIEGLIEIFVEKPPQRNPAKGQVAAILQGAGAYLHHAGHAYTDGKNLLHRNTHFLRQLLRHAGQVPGQGIRRLNLHYLHLLSGQDAAPVIHQSGLQVCCANVNANVIHLLFLRFASFSAS